LPSVCNFIKRSLEAPIWGSRWSNHIKYCFYQTVVVVFVYIYIHCLFYVNLCLYCYTQKGFICNKDYYHIFYWNNVEFACVIKALKKAMY
jgi:hypothetical protein